MNDVNINVQLLVSYKTIVPCERHIYLLLYLNLGDNIIKIRELN